jgi:Ca2+-transporting ATPase
VAADGNAHTTWCRPRAHPKPWPTCATCRTDSASAGDQAQAARLADRGLRVLGVAKAHASGRKDWPGRQHDFAFEWVGLVGLADPLRPEVPQAMAQCRRAGIRVVMITGDHPRTARPLHARPASTPRGADR